MEEFIILGKWYLPSGLDIRGPAYGIKGPVTLPGTYTWEYRPPSYIRRISLSSSSWHQDCSGYCRWVILWSDAYPTEFRLTDGRIVTGEPNDVILVRNDIVYHRASPKMLMDIRSGVLVNRNFMRAILNVYSVTENDISEWRRELLTAESGHQ